MPLDMNYVQKSRAGVLDIRSGSDLSSRLRHSSFVEPQEASSHERRNEPMAASTGMPIAGEVGADERPISVDHQT